jgi:carbonic anhydrase
MEQEGVRISLRNLMSFPWVRERVEDGRLSLHGAYFAIADGVLHLLDRVTGEFAPAA